MELHGEEQGGSSQHAFLCPLPAFPVLLDLHFFFHGRLVLAARLRLPTHSPPLAGSTAYSASTRTSVFKDNRINQATLCLPSLPPLTGSTACSASTRPPPETWTTLCQVSWLLL